MLTEKTKKIMLNNIKAFDNLDLLFETLSLAGGDDYDGCFTKEGEWQYNQMCAELLQRLSKVGFISDEDAVSAIDQSSDLYQSAFAEYTNLTYSIKNGNIPLYHNPYDVFILEEVVHHKQYLLGWICAEEHYKS